ncbi:MAG: transcriptional repressor LexA [Eubacterium sp.]|nr:transcriptional repressor LexA [Eubacterium sp.]
MDKNTLTKRQEEIYAFIKDCILNKGYPPSVREIGDKVGLSSTSSVFAHLEALEKKGFIRRDQSKSRTIEIVDDDEFNLSRREIVNVPLIGEVAAGQPLLATENIMDYIPVLPQFLSNNQTFMLKVKGESMINAGIFDKDILIVEQTPEVSNGEIAVCLVDDSATVKRFYKENGHFRLQPENDSMEPIIVNECTVVGRVIGLMRTYR